MAAAVVDDLAGRPPRSRSLLPGGCVGDFALEENADAELSHAFGGSAGPETLGQRPWDPVGAKWHQLNGRRRVRLLVTLEASALCSLSICYANFINEEIKGV